MIYYDRISALTSYRTSWFRLVLGCGGHEIMISACFILPMSHSEKLEPRVLFGAPGALPQLKSPGGQEGPTALPGTNGPEPLRAGLEGRVGAAAADLRLRRWPGPGLQPGAPTCRRGAWRQEQREAMDFYSAFAFQKEAPGAPTCREVAEGGHRVSASEQRQVWRPRSAGLCQRAPATWKQTV